MNVIKLELNTEEAESFKAWRKHQDNFDTMLNAGVFELKNGSAILTFNKDGVLQGIRKEVESYRRGKKSMF